MKISTLAKFDGVKLHVILMNFTLQNCYKFEFAKFQRETNLN